MRREKVRSSSPSMRVIVPINVRLFTYSQSKVAKSRCRYGEFLFLEMLLKLS